MIRPVPTVLAAVFLALTSLSGAALAAPPPAVPAEPSAATSPVFTLVGAAPDLSQVGFVDSAGMVRSGKQVTVWAIWIWPDQPMLSGKHVSYVMRRNVYDCKANSTRQDWVKIYTADGEVVFEGPPKDKPAFEKIESGTIGETAIAFVCGGKVPHPDIATPTSIEDAVAAARELVADRKRDRTV